MEHPTPAPRKTYTVYRLTPSAYDRPKEVVVSNGLSRITLRIDLSAYGRDDALVVVTPIEARELAAELIARADEIETK